MCFVILSKKPSDARLSGGRLVDVAFMGMRAAVGFIFIAHGVGKFDPGFAGFISNRMGLPPEIAILLALAETVGGILVIIGIFSRISSAWLSIIMVSVIFVLKGAQSLTGDGGTELDVLMLGALLVLMVAGPGKVSLAHILKRLPRFLH